MSAAGSKRKLPCETESSEENIITWEIENFREIITSATNAKLFDEGYIFEAGDNIELPSTWKLYLEKNDQNKLGLFMKLLQAPEQIPKVKGSFGYKTLKSGKKFVCPHEFAVAATSGGGWGWPNVFSKLNNFRFGFKSMKDKDETSKNAIVDECCTPNGSWGWEDAFFRLDDFPEENLENGSLVINVTFSLYKDIIVDDEYKRAKFDHKSRNASGYALQKLLNSGNDANVTFEMVDGRTLKAHGAILKAGSPVFSSMIQTAMEEEAPTCVIRIEDVSYKVMKRILKFIYTGKLDGKWEKVIKELVYASKKFELHLLWTFCDENLATTCKPENAWNLMDFAKLRGLKTAEAEIAEYFKTHTREILQAKISQN